MDRMFGIESAIRWLMLVVCVSLSACSGGGQAEFSQVADSLPVTDKQDAPPSPSPTERLDATEDPADASTPISEQSSISLDGIEVDVLFATDRLPTEALVPNLFRSLLPAVAVISVAAAMLIGLLAARRFQLAWLLSSGLGICLSMTTLHSSIIRWQQYSRLANNAATRFSTTRYEAAENAYPLHLGSARVGIPKIHAPGELESPSILRLEFVEDPGKHVMLRSVVVDDSPTDWFSRVSEQVRYAAAREGFIFIHGFNVRFADALKRTAQLSHDLEIDGPVISYSWPSRGQATAYAADEATIAWSAPHFERLLIDLYTKTDCRTFNIVAHSMGNRALLEAIERIYLRMGGPNAKPGNPRLINELVLAAPDVDAGEFRSRYVRAIEHVAKHATLYFSEHDFALRLSETLHLAPRLGSDGEAAGLGGIESICVGQHGLFTTGHAYYGGDRAVLDDMASILNLNASAHQRKHLQIVRDEHGHCYWQLDRNLHASREKFPNR